uniref:TNFR-Cys domain-containing protein n=1 Tax=Rhizophagus irregularis (strain DAOM 181602 / DAOM 197198 / MUCL 43194) TaxID=747089 RepID=U9T4D1_RHIID
MSRFKIIYTILLLLALSLFFGIFFGLGYPEIQKANYISTYCTIDDKTISSKYCCYKKCNYCNTANAVAPICTDLKSQWNLLSPETCASAVLANSSLSNVCPINDLKGECDDGYYCCSKCCSTCTSCSNSCSSPGSSSSCKYRENLNGAEQFLAKYPISSTIQCFYSPKDPFKVLLNVQLTVKTWVAVGITASFLTIILMYGTWYLFSKNATIFKDYKYRVLIMEIALWCGTIIPPLLILIDLIPFTNGKILWTLAVIFIALGFFYFY